MTNDDLSASDPQPSPGPPMPIGIWVRLEIPHQPALLGFTYVDQQAGFSAQGWMAEGTDLDRSTRVIARLPMLGVPWSQLEPNEIATLGLESYPSWVTEFYGPQPPVGTLWGSWREHPKLKGRFLPDYPDDLQVFVHDGGPRFSRNAAEAVWVTVTGMSGEVFQGRVLNQPHHLESVCQGSQIKFVVADGAEFPVMVTDKYLQERENWSIRPCRNCGFSELFDAPSDLIRMVFPNVSADAEMTMFTAFCPLCGGVQSVKSRSGQRSVEREAATSVPSTGRPWWRFW